MISPVRVGAGNPMIPKALLGAIGHGYYPRFRLAFTSKNFCREQVEQ